MDGQSQDGRSLSASQGHSQTQHQPNNINQSQPPSSNNSFAPNDPNGLGLNLDSQQQQSQQFVAAVDGTFDPSFTANDFMNSQSSQQSESQPFDATSFDPSASFGQQPVTTSGVDPSLAFNTRGQQFLPQNLNDGDFSLFPTGSTGEQFNAPLFEQQSSLSPTDMNSMASPQSHHSPSSPGLLQPSGQQSPSFNQTQFSPSNSNHSRNVSLGPEAALLPGQVNEWSQPQFQGHRRSPSEYSDVSSVSPSPNLISSDSFDHDPSHSPLQRASDGHLYQEMNFNNFNLADPHGRSPSHSPAMSPRISPQNIPDMSQQQYLMQGGYQHAPVYPSVQAPQDYAIPNSELSPMAAPAINIDFAPNNAKPGEFGSKSQLDQGSLLPPDRGMCIRLLLTSRAYLTYNYY